MNGGGRFRYCVAAAVATILTAGVGAEGPGGPVKASTEEALLAELVRPIAEDGEVDRRVREVMETPVDLDYLKTPLATVVDDLRKRLGGNVVVDLQGLRNAEVEPTAPITFRCRGVKLKNAMKALLSPLNLSIAHRNELTWITDADSSGRWNTHRLYPVADLLATPDGNVGDFSAWLINVVTEAIARDGFDCANADERIQFVAVSQGMLAYCRVELHEKIERLFQGLRAARRRGDAILRLSGAPRPADFAGHSAARAEPAPRKEAPPAEPLRLDPEDSEDRALRSALEARADFDIRGASFAEVAALFKSRFGVTIELLNSDPPTEGDRRLPPSFTLSARSIRVRSALGALLRPHGLAHFSFGGVVKAASAAKWRRLQEPSRLYHAADLMTKNDRQRPPRSGTGLQVQELADLEARYAGESQFVVLQTPVAGVLLVKGPLELHNRTEWLLAALRECRDRTPAILRLSGAQSAPR